MSALHPTASLEPRQNKGLRVFHLVRSLSVGGLEQVVIDLCRSLAVQGVESYVGTLVDHGVRWRDACAKGIWDGNISQSNTLISVVRLARYLMCHNIDVVHSHNPTPHLYAVLVGFLWWGPIVHTKHGRNYPANPRRVWLNRQLARRTSRIVAVSDDARQVAVDIERVPVSMVSVIRNGIDTSHFQICTEAERVEARLVLSIPQHAFVVGSIGRFSKEKNYGLMVDAFADFLRCNVSPDPMLLLVGDGPERKDAETRAARHGISTRCMFVGMQDDVRPFVRSMDVFSLSSLTEGTSLTLLEAGACGLVAVVTDVGGNREVVKDGYTGILLPSMDRKAMVQAWRKLAADPLLRFRMGKAARERVCATYSLAQVGNQYMDVYTSVLHKKSIHWHSARQ